MVHVSNMMRRQSRCILLVSLGYDDTQLGQTHRCSTGNLTQYLLPYVPHIEDIALLIEM